MTVEDKRRGITSARRKLVKPKQQEVGCRVVESSGGVIRAEEVKPKQQIEGCRVAESSGLRWSMRISVIMNGLKSSLEVLWIVTRF